MSHPENKCWKEFGKLTWVLAMYGGKPTPSASSTPTSSMTSVPTALESTNYQISVSLSELAHLQASCASAMHVPPSASTSLASLATSLASYTGENATTTGMFTLSASHMTWVIDSRASAHMTGTSSIINPYHPNSSLLDVHIVDGHPYPVKGSGTTHATSTMHLHNVLYGLGFPTNLLSISAITKALNCDVFFYPYHCVFQDLCTGQRIGLGRENGREIYELMADTPFAGPSALFSLSTPQCSSHTSLLWHCQLGHPCFLKLKEALPWITLCSFKCESWELGKHHQSSYSACIGIPSSRPFGFVHCDIWGPAQHVSTSGGRYYIIFVDDYTRVSWTYISKSKKEALDKVQQFVMEIITQYNTTPKELHTDNALEFTQTALQELCARKGILHQTTCPYTSQQNGVAERKHRHLLDMVRTMLVGMNVLMYLWSDDVLTATFLIN